jgi:succinate-acetate transporter protein
MQTQATRVGNGNGSAADVAQWQNRTRVFLQPIAAPSILGLFGFAGATFVVSAYLAGWYGTTATPTYLFPFAAAFGGIAQFAAALWGFRARDGLATAMHGMWGSFWIAFGILNLLVATGDLTMAGPAAFHAFGYWFYALAVITALGAVAASFENLGLTLVLATLAVGSAFLGIGYNVAHTPTAGHGWLEAGGWVLIASAILATYTAAAMMFESAAGRVILPLGKYTRKAAVPGERFTTPIEFEYGEVGVRHGQ